MYKLWRYILVNGLDSGLHTFNRYSRRNMKLAVKLTGLSSVTGKFKLGNCAPCKAAAVVFRLNSGWRTDDIQGLTSCSCSSTSQAD